MKSVAIADVDVHARERLARRFEIARQYAEADALLADPDVALVVICTPPSAHPDLALAAIAAGKHVLVEKPLALDVEAAERMAEAERATSVVTAVGLNLRCHRLVEVSTRDRRLGEARADRNAPHDVDGGLRARAAAAGVAPPPRAWRRRPLRDRHPSRRPLAAPAR